MKPSCRYSYTTSAICREHKPLDFLVESTKPSRKHSPTAPAGRKYKAPAQAWLPGTEDRRWSGPVASTKPLRRLGYADLVTARTGYVGSQVRSPCAGLATAIHERLVVRFHARSRKYEAPAQAWLHADVRDDVLVPPVASTKPLRRLGYRRGIARAEARESQVRSPCAGLAT